MRVAGYDAFTPHESEEDAEGDLPDAVALGLVEMLDLADLQTFDELAYKHAERRQMGEHAWHGNVQVIAELPLEKALVLGLDLVVELLPGAAP